MFRWSLRNVPVVLSLSLRVSISRMYAEVPPTQGLETFVEKRERQGKEHMGHCFPLLSLSLLFRSLHASFAPNRSERENSLDYLTEREGSTPVDRPLRRDQGRMRSSRPEEQLTLAVAERSEMGLRVLQ